MARCIQILIISILIISCSNTTTYKQAENISPLEVNFNSSEWDGKYIPDVGKCSSCGGEGLSPELRVTNIPQGVNAIIVEFNNYSDSGENVQGKLGAIWVPVDTETEVTIPSIKENTTELPNGVFCETENSMGNSLGFYKAPCGQGSVTKYGISVKAVYKAPNENEESILLGKTEIDLGMN